MICHEGPFLVLIQSGLLSQQPLLLSIQLPLQLEHLQAAHLGKVSLETLLEGFHTAKVALIDATSFQILKHHVGEGIVRDDWVEGDEGDWDSGGGDCLSRDGNQRVSGLPTQIHEQTFGHKESRLAGVKSGMSEEVPFEFGRVIQITSEQDESVAS